MLDAGHRISINTAMASTAKWDELIKLVPQSAVLTESDGPFVKLDGGPASPSNMDIVLRWLAGHWNTDAETAAKRVSENYRALFGSFA